MTSVYDLLRTTTLVLSLVLTFVLVVQSVSYFFKMTAFACEGLVTRGGSCYFQITTRKYGVMLPG